MFLIKFMSAKYIDDMLINFKIRNIGKLGSQDNSVYLRLVFPSGLVNQLCRLLVTQRY